MAATILRGHHLFCLPGFRGYGYSPEHAAVLARVKDLLWSYPETVVKVIVEADDICVACPHHKDGSCKQEPGGEARVRCLDHMVLRQLGMKVGTCLTWQEVVCLLRVRVDKEDLQRICAACRWLPYGYCQEGLAGIKVSKFPA